VSVSLRDARAGEERTLADLVIAQPLLVRYQVTTAGLQRDLEAARAGGDGMIVVEEGGVSRGFAWFMHRGTFGPGGYLRLIALQPGTEGRGLGAALLDEVERRVAAHSRTLFLLVSHWNHAARRFYAARGYAEAGVLPAFVRPDSDEVICYKRLTPPSHQLDP
jgi:ribosomal protein S18 acetylase RimI-like enzyme